LLYKEKRCIVITQTLLKITNVDAFWSTEKIGFDVLSSAAIEIYCLSEELLDKKFLGYFTKR